MPFSVSVPGRVNLIGEHIDYHNLPVLPMAIQRRVKITYEPRPDAILSARSCGHPDREFTLDETDPFPAGHWGNYLKAAVRMLTTRWPITTGVDAEIASDLPSAAGLSSSSALLTGIAIALLRANGIEPSVAELLEILPEGEQFVGTRGGGMDHAAVLASRSGCALLIHFAPLHLEPIRLPPDWTFLVAHSLTHAEKSGALKAEYNARRTAGNEALRLAGFTTYQDVLRSPDFDSLERKFEAKRNEPTAAAFLHVTGEARRVQRALDAIRKNEASSFGKILLESHASLRDLLKVSNPALDRLVDCAMESAALGARLTGAGFGGCAIVFCMKDNADSVRKKLTQTFYNGAVSSNDLFIAEASDGALHV